MNMTTLHFHGLNVSPDEPQDDVITMMAMPGQSFLQGDIPQYQRQGCIVGITPLLWRKLPAGPCDGCRERM